MSWLLALTVGGITVMTVYTIRSMRYIRKGRPNYAEKELTSTAYDYNLMKSNHKRYFCHCG